MKKGGAIMTKAEQFSIDIIALEDLADKADRLSNMSQALYDAMFEGPTCADDYGSAMFLFVEMMDTHSESMKAFFEAVHAERKAQL